MSNITIQEDYILPSLGKIYKQQFDPIIKLRSMTVAEEMKRLSATENPYKIMAEIIEDCLETKLPISVYDMCLGDYQFLLHKLRTVTYGPEYKMAMVCPYCGEIFEKEINLDELEIHRYEEGLLDNLTFELPVSKYTVTIGFQTPRDLDNIEREKKYLKKQFPDMDDPTIMLNIESMIKQIDGQPKNPMTIREIIKNMPLRDSSLIMQRVDKLNEKVGVDIKVEGECPLCLSDVKSSFRFTSEFFRPQLD